MPDFQTKGVASIWLLFLTRKANMQKILWNNDAQPINSSIARVLYELQFDDMREGYLFDALRVQDIERAADQVLAFDALVADYNKLERKMHIMGRQLNAAGKALTLANEKPQITQPFTKNGTANVAAIFELSDGQTISVFFHNPDITPKKIQPTDVLVSWKWLLNKKDVTIVVAPEKGQDLNVREVAKRIMLLAEKNSAAFTRKNAKRAEQAAQRKALEAEITQLEAELKTAEKELSDAEVELEGVKSQELSVQSAEPLSNAQEIADKLKAFLPDFNKTLDHHLRQARNSKTVQEKKESFRALQSLRDLMAEKIEEPVRQLQELKAIHLAVEGDKAQWHFSKWQSVRKNLNTEIEGLRAQLETLENQPQTINAMGRDFTPNTINADNVNQHWQASLDLYAGDVYQAAVDFYNQNLKGRYVKTIAGDVLMTGKGGREVKEWMRKKPLLAEAVPFIPVILENAQHYQNEDLYKSRQDNITMFRRFEGTQELSSGVRVQAVVKVALQSDGQMFYYLNADEITMDDVKEKTPKQAIYLGVNSQPRTSPYDRDDRENGRIVHHQIAILDNAGSLDDVDCGLEIIRAWDKDGREIDPETLQPT